jgi:HSP20 family molecular chaperone IbpA
MPVKEDKVEATYDKGVLQIVMPKAEKAKSEKKIKVKIKK